MSACISNSGEYSEHFHTHDLLTCDRCGSFTEDAAIEYIDALRTEVVSLTAERDELRAKIAAVEALVEDWSHETVEDCWYSCGLTFGTAVDDACCNAAVAGICSCSTGSRQAQIRAALDNPEPLLAKVRADALRAWIERWSYDYGFDVGDGTFIGSIADAGMRRANQIDGGGA